MAYPAFCFVFRLFCVNFEDISLESNIIKIKVDLPHLINFIRVGKYFNDPVNIPDYDRNNNEELKPMIPDYDIIIWNRKSAVLPTQKS